MIDVIVFFWLLLLLCDYILKIFFAFDNFTLKKFYICKASEEKTNTKVYMNERKRCSMQEKKLYFFKCKYSIRTAFEVFVCLCVKCIYREREIDRKSVGLCVCVCVLYSIFYFTFRYKIRFQLNPQCFFALWPSSTSGIGVL